MEKLDKASFLRLTIVLDLLDFMLIACFIGDILVLTGTGDSPFIEYFGYFPIYWAIVVEVILFIVSVFFWVICLVRYKYGEK